MQQTMQTKIANTCRRFIVAYHRRIKRRTQAMRLHHAAPIAMFIALLISPAHYSAQDNLGTYDDRIAVEDVMARYVWTVDSLDADGYVAVFTDDAVIDSNGNISKGHGEI